MKCALCNDTGMVGSQCPDGRPGCAVYHMKACKCQIKEPEQISKPIDRVMDKVFAKYESNNSCVVSPETRALAMAMMKLEMDKPAKH